jgi:hypothetical protein
MIHAPLDQDARDLVGINRRAVVGGMEIAGKEPAIELGAPLFGKRPDLPRV